MQIQIASSIVLFEQRMEENKITMTKIKDKRIIESTSFWFLKVKLKRINFFTHIPSFMPVCTLYTFKITS